MSPKHETVKSCPSACQHSSAQLPPKEPASPCLRQPMTLSPGFRIVARLSGAVPPKKFPAFHDTHTSCQRQAKTGQPIVVLLSLTWLHQHPTPHLQPRRLSLHALGRREGRRRRQTLLYWLTITRSVFARAYAPGHHILPCNFRPLAEYQTLPRRVGPVAVQLRNLMELPLLPPSPPPPPGRRPPQPSRFISSLFPRYRPRDSATAARCRFRDGSAFPAI